MISDNTRFGIRRSVTTERNSTPSPMSRFRVFLGGRLTNYFMLVCNLPAAGSSSGSLVTVGRIRCETLNWLAAGVKGDFRQ